MFKYSKRATVHNNNNKYKKQLDWDFGMKENMGFPFEATVSPSHGKHTLKKLSSS